MQKKFTTSICLHSQNFAFLKYPIEIRKEGETQIGGILALQLVFKKNKKNPQ